MQLLFRLDALRTASRSLCSALLLLLPTLALAAERGAQDPRLAVSATAPFLLRSVVGVERVAGLTGADSPNRTDRYQVEGTDLGSMFSYGGKTWFVFGDTFGKRKPGTVGAAGERWRSNTVAFTTDTDPSDGITFDGMLVDTQGGAAQLVPSKKVDHDEMTVIPTHGFAAGKAMYLHWMSVKHWGKPGEWETNGAGLAKSSDEGRTWKVLDAPRWEGESPFIQVAPATVKEGGQEWLYFWGSTHGRFGGVALMKVPAAQVEQQSAYRYFTGTDAKGAPQWGPRAKDAKLVVDDTVGELSVVWNAYLGRWLMSYLKEGTGVMLREGLTPWGPWGAPLKMMGTGEAAGPYAPFMAEHYVGDGGRTIYFSLSAWGPYNVSWYKAQLSKQGGEELAEATAVR